MKTAHEKSTVEFLVLCGHTHGEAKYQPINNEIRFDKDTLWLSQKM